MNDIEYEKISEFARKITSFTFVLKGICENYEQDISEFAKLYEFVKILDETSNEIFGLL